MSKEWFEDWFDSDYYHTLYHLHDRKEAKILFESFLAHYPISVDAKMLDLACGKGRFAAIVAEKGLDVTGLDLSTNSISYANQFATDHLYFYVHDMRKPFRINYFSLIFNIFTSFGYFNTIDDNLRTLKAVYQGLTPDGYFVLDYLNADYIKANLVKEETLRVDGVQFDIQRWIDKHFVYKQIHIKDKAIEKTFTEKVQLFDLEEFKELFLASGLQLKAYYGNYEFAPFDHHTSKRLILIAQKNA